MSTDITMCARPGLGTAGRRMQVSVNVFPLREAPDYTVYHYDVALVPDARVPAPVKRRVIEQLFRTEQVFNNTHAVYDGQKNMFVPRHALPFESNTFSLILPEEDGRPAREGRERRFQITVTFAAPVNLTALTAFVGGQLAQTTSALMAVTALNILLRHGPATLHTSKAASIYPAPETPRDKMEIMGGIEMWRGYYSSLRPTPQRLVVNIDSTAMAFVQSGDLVQVCCAFLNVSDPARISNVTDRDRMKLARFLRGLRVEILVGAQRNVQRRKIAEYHQLPASQRTFTDGDGKQWTVQTYFRSLNVTLRFPNLGCVRVTKTAWYPLEHVRILPGNKHTAKLTPDQIAKVLEFTSKRPSEKRDLIRQGLQKLGYNSNAHVKAWGIEVSGDPLTTNARVLPPPTLLAGGPKQTALVRCKDDGQYDARSKSFFKPATILSWLVVVFDTPAGDGRRSRGTPLPAVQQMVTLLSEACSRKGMQVMNPQPKIVHVGDIQPQDVGKNFFDIIQQELEGKKPQLIVCFLPSKTDFRYGTIKRLGDTLQGFATQCMVIEKAIRRDPSYFQNVALKINPKLGGVNQILGSPFPVPGVKDPTADPFIVFGADVAHPGPGSMAPSIAGVVATTDIYSVSYSTQTRPQSSRVEIIQDLEEMAVQLLRDFYRCAKKQPTRIIFYRDGVSEGQFASVVIEEVAALRRACARLDQRYAPKLTYIICGKRHHIRLFPQNAPPPGAKGWQLNVPPGTVVDEGCVHPRDFDWYAVHHAGMLGTSRPTHYSVLVDENSFSADEMQGMTNSFAWLFQRCAKAVNIVSPAYFAHLACTRAKAHLDAARRTDDDSATMTSDSQQMEQIRASALALARNDLRPIHTNLFNTMPWM